MTDMAATSRMTLEEYLALDYPFVAHPDPEGGYVILFPDLPGCMTQVETIEEIGTAASEICALWIESEYEDGKDIPLPSYPEEYSGKFNLRLPRSLHRILAEGAERNNVSLNTYVIGLLERGHLQTSMQGLLQELEGRLVERIQGLEAQLDTLHENMRYRPTGVPKPARSREAFEVVQAKGYRKTVAA
jgi:antitoxin HicB